MDLDSSITEFIAGVKAGNDEAVRAIWDRCFPQLVQLAGQRLAGQKRQMADEEDVAISVMESFFRAAREGRFPDLRDSDGVWRLLATMTSRKVIDLVRRNAARPVVGESGMFHAEQIGNPLDAQAGRDPTPEMLAMVHDEVDRLLQLLPEKYHEIALKKLECLTVPEIAKQCGVHVSTVERKLRIIRAVWARELDDLK